MPKVYVVQHPTRIDRQTGQKVTMDITPALAYGELELLLPAGNVVLTPGPMMQELARKLKHFSDDDYLLPLGDPAAIGAACIEAAAANRGRVKMLKWDRETRKYYVVTLERRGL